jgi:hypothetical protein
MADESELRRMLEREAAGAPAPELDAGRLVRRTRGRRLPRQLAAGGALTLAVIGLGVGTVTGVRLLNPPSEVTSAESGGQTTDEAPREEAGTLSAPETEDSAGDAGEGAAGGGIELAPAYKLNICTGMLATAPEDGFPGVSVDVDFPDDASVPNTVHGSVHITNDTGERLRGVMSDIAATTLSGREGRVHWHTPRMERTLPVDLAPGESTTLDASFEPLACLLRENGEEVFGPALAPVFPGSYNVSVAFDIELEDGTVLQVVSGTEPILLR